MLTRRQVTSQYAKAPGDRAAPPLHVAMSPHQRPAPQGDRARLYGTGGGLMGGAVILTAGGRTGMRRGRTGYGYLGMDPSDPSTWPRPFVPTTGMISYLNFGALA
jgi:hypothetical protein